MEEGKEVKVHGMWISTYSIRVELALKVKGISYEYVEEDLSNKSQLLLNYNPVHKKVPVLVHNGNPISESSVILEYIDEEWKNNSPSLLPDDPYQTAKVRFWATYVQEKLFVEGMSRLITSKGVEQKKAVELEMSEKLKVFEEGMKEMFPGGRVGGGIELGLLDIMVCATLGAHKAVEQVLGAPILCPQNTPFTYEWVATLKELPLVKQVEPSHDKMVAFLNFITQI